MKKRLLAGILAMAMMMTLAMVLTGCGGADVSEHPLVGNWAWEDYANYVYTFYPDGTGTRGGGGIPREDITWSIPRDGRLTINREGDVPRNEIRREQWDYSIDGDVFTIESRQDSGRSYSFNRVGAGDVTPPADTPGAEPIDAEALLGSWAWENDADWLYVFEAEGQGSRMRFDGTGPEAFEWSLDGDTLRLSSPDGTALSAGIAEEIWAVSINDAGVLNLTSRQDATAIYNYVRVED